MDENLSNGVDILGPLGVSHHIIPYIYHHWIDLHHIKWLTIFSHMFICIYMYINLFWLLTFQLVYLCYFSWPISSDFWPSSLCIYAIFHDQSLLTFDLPACVSMLFFMTNLFWLLTFQLVYLCYFSWPISSDFWPSSLCIYR